MKRGDSEIGQEQVQDLLFNREIGWQEIIYDLINTEQLDPWNIDITVLVNGFLNKVQEYEEMDFFVSSKVLLAAALLLRIKSELILNKYLRSIDNILFGEKEEGKNSFEKLELDEDIPDLIPRSPMTRLKKVTLKELIESLNKAIITENRRIKKAIVNKNALRETNFSLSRRKYNIGGRIKDLRSKINLYFSANVSHKKVIYEKIVGENKEERALSLFPMLQLESNGELWLEQENHFGSIHIWLKKVFLKHNPDPYEDLKEGYWDEKLMKKAELLTEEETKEEFGEL